jgi:hypothetical protein
MFEELQQEEKELKEMRRHQIWISGIIVVALVVLGGAVFLITKPFAKKAPVAAETSAPAAKEAAPDPVRDLQVVRAVMGKDVSGVRVMWSVQLRNKSSAYTYSDVEYEARFLRPDGSVLAVSRGTIPCNLAPGDEEKIPDFMGGIYDASASTYNFVLVGAKATPAQ